MSRVHRKAKHIYLDLIFQGLGFMRYICVDEVVA